MLHSRKAAIVGCGFVGSSIAFALMQQGLFTELVLIDANRPKAEGEAMDLSHGLPYLTAMDIRAGTYEDLAGCALVIVTAGANQKPGETRLDLIGKNVAILRDIIPQITRQDFGGILLIVTNPVDALTYAAWRLSGYPRHRVIGSGTVLDTGRLKFLLGSVSMWTGAASTPSSSANTGTANWPYGAAPTSPASTCRPFFRLQGVEDPAQILRETYEAVRDSAYEIIRRKGATYYGIAMAVARIASSIVKDERAVLPVSVVLEGEYALQNLCLSVPSIVGQAGLEQVLEIPLDASERRALAASAGQLRQVMGEMSL